MGDKVANIFGAVVTLAVVTTLVLPGRQTAKVIDSVGSAFTGSIRAAMGR